MSGRPWAPNRRPLTIAAHLQPHLNPADKISKFGGVSLAAATRTGPPFEARFDAYPQDHRPVVPTVASGLILTEPFTGTATAGVMLKHAGRGGEAALETAHQARFGRLKTEVGG